MILIGGETELMGAEPVQVLLYPSQIPIGQTGMDPGPPWQEAGGLLPEPW
jgi:hypothetical protein